jgi:hypothetical protein
MTEQATMIAAKLYEKRRTAKFMLGEGYSTMTREVAGIIRDIIAKSPRKDLSPLVVASEMTKAPGIDAQQAIIILAASVDMAEGVI